MQALRLNWPRCRKGYEVLEIRRSAIVRRPAIEWDEENFTSTPAADATAAERGILAKWGDHLSRYAFEEGGQIVRVIAPRNETVCVGNVLANAPDLFVEFANINGSEVRLLNFVNKHGPLRHDSLLPVWSGLKRAAKFQEVLGQFESDKLRGSKRWLASFDDLRPSTDECDLKVVPKIHAGELQVWLEPPDLLNAIWVQFLLKAANDMALTHCHSCSNFIAVAGSLGRTDKRFCSTACKQRDYRRREVDKKASRSRATGARRVANRRQAT
jgi:hypothetical protein